MNETTDDNLITASLERPEHFDELFARHWPAIARYLIRRLGSNPGEDLAGEVFLRAFAARERFVPGSGDARPWLFGIAAKLISEHRRGERRRLRALQRVKVQAQPAGDEASDAVRRLDAASAAEPVLKRLRRLPLAYRETVFLWVWGELSYEEIARALDVPVGTVRSRISRARAGLVGLDCTPKVSNPVVEDAHV
jgi:RNA polymerase sigma factor (sigma-70 family)